MKRIKEIVDDNFLLSQVKCLNEVLFCNITGMSTRGGKSFMRYFYVSVNLALNFVKLNVYKEEARF
jgi:hypothetical protein